MSLSQNVDESMEGKPITSDDELGKISRNQDYSDDVDVFYSSSGMEEGKAIGLSPEDQERLSEAFQIAYDKMGVTEDDAVINWGADPGVHQSHWALKYPMEDIGADVINESYEEVVSGEFGQYEDRFDEATVIGSIPTAFITLGKKLEKEYGEKPREIFPNARIGITAGDRIKEEDRQWIEENYDIDLKGLYAGTEPGPVAVETEHGIYEPINPNLVVEILEVGEEEEQNYPSEQHIHNLNELETGEEVSGSMLISAPLRDELPLERVRIGDLWTAWGTEDGPRMNFEGREDNVIRYGPAMLYPDEVHDLMDEMGFRDFKTIVVSEDETTRLDFYTPGEAPDEEEVKDGILDRNKSAEAWEAADILGVRTDSFDSFEELQQVLDDEYDLRRDSDGDIEVLNDIRKPPKTAKRKHFGFDSSYRVDS